MHRTKKMYAIKTFYFRKGKATPQNFTSQPDGERGIFFGIKLTYFQIENPNFIADIFFVRCVFLEIFRCFMIKKTHPLN